LFILNIKKYIFLLVSDYDYENWSTFLHIFKKCRCFYKKFEERVGVGGRGKYPGAPPHHLRKKEGRRRKKQLADRKVPDRPGVVKGEGY
jgi:hypothetical protein